MTTAQLEQRDKSLRLANEVRVARAQLKRDLRAGAVNPIRLVMDPPDYAARMTVSTMLRAVPKVGVVKAKAIPRRAGFSEDRRLADLTDRQRHQFAMALRRVTR
ncbi:MAG: hypothetical protein H0U59_03410 [Gemmatimonadaceae bacterium]|nr:hypothetical protein [Gemmatimonadaceae bacterium]